MHDLEWWTLYMLRRIRRCGFCLELKRPYKWDAQTQTDRRTGRIHRTAALWRNR